MAVVDRRAPWRLVATLIVVLSTTTSPLLALQQATAHDPLATCPVTRPNNDVPPTGLPQTPSGATDEPFYGNGKLWTSLWWPDGVILSSEVHYAADGALSVKTPWFRGPESAGALTISGRRLDGEAPPLRGDVPDGYGDLGFQVSGILYPSPGCWEVTGRAGSVSLTFIVFVVFKPPFPDSAPGDYTSVTRSAGTCPVTTNRDGAAGGPAQLVSGLTAAGPGAPAVPIRSNVDDFFGAGGLWTNLWPDGIITFAPDAVGDDGAIQTNVVWFRDEPARGPLEITGRHLHRTAPSLRADVRPGYGVIGFQPSRLTFSSPGCWEVTATSGTASLTFVTLVVVEPAPA